MNGSRFAQAMTTSARAAPRRQEGGAEVAGYGPETREAFPVQSSEPLLLCSCPPQREPLECPAADGVCVVFPVWDSWEGTGPGDPTTSLIAGPGYPHLVIYPQ